MNTSAAATVPTLLVGSVLFASFCFASEGHPDLVDPEMGLYLNEGQVCGPVAVFAALAVVGAPQPYSDVRAAIHVSEVGSSLEDCRLYLKKQCDTVQPVQASPEYIRQFLNERENSAVIVRKSESHWVCVVRDDAGRQWAFNYPEWEPWQPEIREGEAVYALLISNHSAGSSRSPLRAGLLNKALLISLSLLSLVNVTLLLRRRAA